ncbi:hypothetical protein FKM82_005786 [Ascaphus truei]
MIIGVSLFIGTIILTAPPPPQIHLPPLTPTNKLTSGCCCRRPGAPQLLLLHPTPGASPAAARHRPSLTSGCTQVGERCVSQRGKRRRQLIRVGSRGLDSGCRRWAPALLGCGLVPRRATHPEVRLGFG